MIHFVVEILRPTDTMRVHYAARSPAGYTHPRGSCLGPDYRTHAVSEVAFCRRSSRHRPHGFSIAPPHPRRAPRLPGMQSMHDICMQVKGTYTPLSAEPGATLFPPTILLWTSRYDASGGCEAHFNALHGDNSISFLLTGGPGTIINQACVPA